MLETYHGKFTTSFSNHGLNPFAGGVKLIKDPKDGVSFLPSNEMCYKSASDCCGLVTSVNYDL